MVNPLLRHLATYTAGIQKRNDNLGMTIQASSSNFLSRSLGLFRQSETSYTCKYLFFFSFSGILVNNEAISKLTIQHLPKLIVAIYLAKMNESFTINIFAVKGVRIGTS